MKWWDDEIMIWWYDEMMIWWNDEMVKLWIIKLCIMWCWMMKWWMTKCWRIKWWNDEWWNGAWWNGERLKLWLSDWLSRGVMSVGLITLGCDVLLDRLSGCVYLGMCYLGVWCLLDRWSELRRRGEEGKEKEPFSFIENEYPPSGGGKK